MNIELRNSKKIIIPRKLLIKNVTQRKLEKVYLTNHEDIAEDFNDFFLNIAPNLQGSYPYFSISFKDFLRTFYAIN